MATRVGLGVPMPLFAPATATFAVPFAAYYIFLQNRIVFRRLTSKTYLGDTSDATEGFTNPLYIATRAQLNFAENVPLALAIALLAELNGADRKYLQYALGALFACRVSHVELGLMRHDGLGAGRIVGYYGTQTILAALAGYTAYLVKGYWQL